MVNCERFRLDCQSKLNKGLNERIPPPTVLHLLLHSGLGFVLGFPENQLRAEDGGDAGRLGDLQHHHPPDARLAARRLQQSSVQHPGAGPVPERTLRGHF